MLRHHAAVSGFSGLEMLKKRPRAWDEASSEHWGISSRFICAYLSGKMMAARKAVAPASDDARIGELG